MVRWSIKNIFSRVPLFILLIAGFSLNVTVCSWAQDAPQFTYDPKGKRNPFIPLVTFDGRLLQLDREETKSDIVVEGVIFDKNGRSYAIVNGAVVGIGDAVEGYQVLKILNDKVILVKDGVPKEIILHKEDK